MNLKNSLIAAVLTANVVFAVGTLSAADWYVAPDGTGGGTSLSDRGDVMSVLYNGQVASGDTIHFAAGTYNLDVNKIPAGSNYGAYLRVPDGISNLTLIGETGNPEDVRLVGNPSDKKRIVYFNHGGNVIRNLLISGGYTDYQGAGICMADSIIGNPEEAFCASNCVVENCSAAYQGGGGFGGLWRDCVIRNNEARNKGAFPEGSAGGVFHAILHDCVITNNAAGFCGGGIAGGRQNGANSNYPICVTRAYNCLIGWNRSVYGGGAAVAPENLTRERCQLFGCTLVENAAAYDTTGDGGGLGGGAYNANTRNCLVTGNVAYRYYALCKGSHYGTLVYGNVNQTITPLAASGIGADAGDSAVAVNCTVWNNDNSSAQFSRTYMTNCIVNSVEHIPSAVNSFWRVGTVENQTGCISGEGLDPVFAGVDISLHPSVVANVAPEAYSIKAGSPYRDMGMTLAGQRDEKDFLGNPRVNYGCVDMGALECDIGEIGFKRFIK